MGKAWGRILKASIPIVLVLGVVGYLYAQLAGMWFGSKTTQAEGITVSGQLENRLPFTMAAWGFLLVLVAEGFRWFWKKPEPKKNEESTTDSEKLLLQLLEQAEAAEKSRESAADISQTPMPGQTKLPVEETATVSSEARDNIR